MFKIGGIAPRVFIECTNINSKTQMSPGCSYYLFNDGVIRLWEDAITEIGISIASTIVYYDSIDDAEYAINYYKINQPCNTYKKLKPKPKSNYTYEFPKSDITVDNIITRCFGSVCVAGRIDVLLVKRKNEPYKSYWALPGGFLNMDETLAQGAKRELKEETGVDADPELFCMADRIDRDPRGRTISAIFTAMVDYDVKAVAADDAEDILWANLDDVMIMDLAFDHKEILEKFINEYIG